MCIVSKMKVVVTLSPFEAARSKLDIYPKRCRQNLYSISWIILNENQLQQNIPFLPIFIEQDANGILYNLCVGMQVCSLAYVIKSFIYV